MYEMKTRVRYSEIDEGGYITLKGIIDLLQDCATIHSHDVGFSGPELSASGRGWFVTDYQIHARSLPRMGDELVTRTYPYSVRGMMASRHFKIYRGDELLITANSIWVFMDIIKVRPVRVPEEMIKAYGEWEPPEEDFGPRKIKLPDRLEKAADFTVEKIHLDINHHMNNGKYIEAIGYLLPKKPEAVRIEYKKQAVEGDEIMVYTGSQDGKFFVTMQKAEDTLFVLEYKGREGA